MLVRAVMPCPSQLAQLLRCGCVDWCVGASQGARVLTAWCDRDQSQLAQRLHGACVDWSAEASQGAIRPDAWVLRSGQLAAREATLRPAGRYRLLKCPRHFATR